MLHIRAYFVVNARPSSNRSWLNQSGLYKGYIKVQKKINFDVYSELFTDIKRKRRFSKANRKAKRFELIKKFFNRFISNPNLQNNLVLFKKLTLFLTSSRSKVVSASRPLLNVSLFSVIWLLFIFLFFLYFLLFFSAEWRMRRLRINLAWCHLQMNLRLRSSFRSGSICKRRLTLYYWTEKWEKNENFIMHFIYRHYKL